MKVRMIRAKLAEGRRLPSLCLRLEVVWSSRGCLFDCWTTVCYLRRMCWIGRAQGWTLQVLASRGNRLDDLQMSSAIVKSCEHWVHVSLALPEVSLEPHEQIVSLYIPLPLLTGNGIVLSFPPSLSKASTSFRILLSCRAVRSLYVRPGTFLARFLLAGAVERLMVLSGT